MESTLIRGFILLLAMGGFAASSTGGGSKFKANDMIPPCLPNTGPCGITDDSGDSN